VGFLDNLLHALESRRRRLPVFYHPLYRLPLPGLEAAMGLEPRRSDFVMWFLEDRFDHRVHREAPRAISYDDLHRVHTDRLLESLTGGEAFSQLFHLPVERLPLDALMLGFRLATGGTLDAARCALRNQDATLNLLGGFHHAAPDKAAGLCPVNDIAVAVAALRARAADPFEGTVLILDLDAHPPDGLAECFAGDDDVRIASLSGSDWGPLPGVDETLVDGKGDDAYLEELEALLDRQPPADLNFVIAGGDVLAGDRLGLVALSEAGARQRDRKVAHHLDGRAAVWLPGGGYHRRAWRLLAQSALEAASVRTKLPRRYDPLAARYARMSKRFTLAETIQNAIITDEDLDEMFGSGRHRPRFLGAYLKEDLERGLRHYGLTPTIEALGYRDLHVRLDKTPEGHRVRVLGRAAGKAHLLIEVVASREVASGRPVLFVNWLTLRDPLRAFEDEDVPHDRPLPGQEVPGLGLSREAGQVLARVARRIHLDGVMVRPAWYHVAWASTRRGFRFDDGARQGRFEALRDHLEGLPLDQASHLVAEGEIQLDGEPYPWEASDLVWWLDETRPPKEWRDAADAAREAARFTGRP
jgi:acetoin utilization deacetylase AcuC-like enzyme